MGVVGRLDQYGSMLAWEFDDYSMSENLLQRSEEFNNAYWTKTISSITANSIISPDGLQTADTLIETASAPTDHTVRRSVSKSASALTYTFSTFAKLKDTRNISINMSGFTSVAEVIVSLSTGNIISGPTVVGSFSNPSANVIPYPNGWYRIILTATTDTFTSVTCTISLANGTTTTYGGDAVSGIYIWGAQLEFGSVATDYTPTTTTAISRVLSATTNTNITGLGTYYSSGFDENVGFTTFLSANILPPYDPVYDDFGGTLFGPGQGRYMRQNTDKSVIVYNEIDEVTDFRDIVRTGLVLDLDAGMNASFNNTRTTWIDLSGNGNNATLTNGPTYSSANGGSIVFDGTNDYGEIPHNASLNISSQISLEGWIYPTVNQGCNVMCKSSISQNNGYIYPRADNNWGNCTLWLYIDGVGWSTLSASWPALNEWHHTIGTYDGSSMKVYIDGSLVASKNQTGTISTNTNPLAIGNQTGLSEYYGGRASNLRIYNRALTAAEVSQNYNALKHRFGL